MNQIIATIGWPDGGRTHAGDGGATIRAMASAMLPASTPTLGAPGVTLSLWTEDSTTLATLGLRQKTSPPGLSSHQAVTGSDPASDTGAGASQTFAPPSAAAAGPGPAVSRASVVVCDASLYYRGDLANSAGLSRGEATELDDATLLLSAYSKHGSQMLQWVEGDFAFVVWDRQRHSLVAARDFVGHRTLFYYCTGAAIVVASTVGAILSHPAVRTSVDLDRVAESAAGLWSHSSRTAFHNVFEVPAGFFLEWRPGRMPIIQQFWSPPANIISQRSSSKDSAAELRELLGTAVRERMHPAAPTSLLLSGGWDSSAIFGVGQRSLRAAPSPGAALLPISMSYPVGDSARENDTIENIARHWSVPVTWQDIDEVTILGKDPLGDAQRRDDPSGHAYEFWNKAMFRRARNSGSPVVLGGGGGDQLFQVSMVYLADLIWSGHLFEALRQWRSRGFNDTRTFVKLALLPRLPQIGYDLVAAARNGAPPRNYLDRLPPPWFRRSWINEHGLDTRDAETRPQLPRHSAMLTEAHSYFVFQSFPRVFGRLYRFGLEEGVELRQPLMDNRVVDFAMRRPWYERANKRESKILLRQAMRGLLPDEVLAPRTRRTGTTESFFITRLSREVEPVARQLLADSALADLGMINRDALGKAWDIFMHNRDDELGVRLFRTLQAELWLRGRGANSAAPIR